MKRLTITEYKALRAAIDDAHAWRGGAHPDEEPLFDLARKQRLAILKRFRPLNLGRPRKGVAR